MLEVFGFSTLNELLDPAERFHKSIFDDDGGFNGELHIRPRKIGAEETRRDLDATLRAHARNDKYEKVGADLGIFNDLLHRRNVRRTWQWLEAGMRVPFAKVVVPREVAARLRKEIIELRLVLRRIADKMSAGSACALNGHIDQTKRLAANMFAQQKTANLTFLRPAHFLAKAFQDLGR